jgi:hypothetical protein
MKKKMWISLACTLAMTLLLVGTAFAAIPSSRSYSQLFQSHTATAYGSIESKSASSSTTYQEYTGLYAKVSLWYKDSEGNGFNFPVTNSNSSSNNSVQTSVSVPAGYSSDLCATEHTVSYNSNIWSKSVNYATVWSVS